MLIIKKNIFVGISLLFASSLLCFFVVEFALRVFNYQTKVLGDWWLPSQDLRIKKQAYYDLNPTRIYSINPRLSLKDESASDEFGFRFNPNHKKLSNKPYVILAFGDSFTFGHGVAYNQTYPYYLENILKKKYNKNIIVHNAGIPGYSPDQTFIYIKENIHKLNPDLIIWNIDISDIIESNQLCLFKKQGNSYQQLPAHLNIIYSQGFILKYAPSIIRNSRLLNLFLSAPTLIAKKRWYTIGCTISDKNMDLVKKGFSQKMNYFFSEIKEMNTNILITLTPLQFYFDRSINNNHYIFQDYKLLIDTIHNSGFPFVNSNAEIAKSASVELYAYRNSSKNWAKLPKNIKVAGEKTVNLSDVFFLEETEFNYGRRHLNSDGNYAFAQAIAAKITIPYDRK